MENARIIARMIGGEYYSLQDIRMRLYNRIRDYIRKKVEKIPFNKVEEKKEKKVRKKKYTDKELTKLWASLLANQTITKREHDTVLEAWELAKDINSLENKTKKVMKRFIKDEPIYTEFLSKIRGLGEVLSLNLIKEFGTCEVIIYDENDDIISRESESDFQKWYNKFKEEPDKYRRVGYFNVSKLWKHCGLDVQNGLAPKLRKGVEITWSPRLRMLVWKISSSLLTQNKGFYRQIYDTEKDKHLNRDYETGFLYEKYGKPYKEEDTKLTLLHAHNRALRKMGKILLDHYWHAARQLVGLSAMKNYVEGVLEHNNVISWRKAIELEGCLIES